MSEYNIVPKFIDEAASPIAQKVGHTVSSVWELVFGGFDNYVAKISYQRQQNFEAFKETFNRKAYEIPEDQLVEPDLHIIGPTLEASKYYFDSDSLRELFANLLSSSINNQKKQETHPAFVDIIKQLNPDEARLLKVIKDKSHPTVSVQSLQGKNNGFLTFIDNFTNLCELAECETREFITSYLQNLDRLGLIKIHEAGERYLIDDDIYKDLMEHDFIKRMKSEADSEGEGIIKKGMISSTPFGKQFYNVCIK